MSNLATAMEIQQSCKESIYDVENLEIASQIFNKCNFNEDVLDLLFKYSASLTASVASRITHILMSESDLNLMINDLEEIESYENK